MLFAPLEQFDKRCLKLAPPYGLLLLEAIVPELLAIVISNGDVENNLGEKDLEKK